MTKCEFCEKERELTFHHLIPVCLHTKKYFQKHFDKHYLKTNGVWVCDQCHSHIHRSYSEKELAKNYNTLDLLIKSEKIQKYIQWIRKH